MLLYNLSVEPSKPCFALRMSGCLVLLDSAVSVQSLFDFQRVQTLSRVSKEHCSRAELKECQREVIIESPPEFSPPLLNLINFSEIDVILVSNFSMILGLPYITENTGFKGIVLATEPTLQIGRLILQELLEYVGDLPIGMSRLRHPPQTAVTSPTTSRLTKPLYTPHQMESSLSKVRVIGYHEEVDVFGSLKIRAVSSGYSLGSCNWLITTDSKRITYVSTSSILATHPRPIDKALLKNADVLILAGLRQKPTTNPDTLLGELCMHIGSTVRDGGNVLLPCYPSGVVYDLIESISVHLANIGLSSVPIFFISPSAEASLAYSNILAEWLSDGKQRKVYLPEEPFSHALLVKTGRLRYFKKIHSEGFGQAYRQPCIIFCGHPSLRFGDSVHFIEQWSNNPLHSLVLTEPDFDCTSAIAPYQPIKMKVLYCPLDTSLNFSEANRLLSELRPKCLVTPARYLQSSSPPSAASQSVRAADLHISMEHCHTYGVDSGEFVRVLLKRGFVRASLSPRLADSLVTRRLSSGLHLASIRASLCTKDNQILIQPLPDDMSTSTDSFDFGDLDLIKFFKNLKKEFHSQITVLKKNSGYIIQFTDGNTTKIHLDRNTTHVFSDDTKLRLKIRNLLLTSLTS